jgi:hypothetical protein
MPLFTLRAMLNTNKGTRRMKFHRFADSGHENSFIRRSVCASVLLAVGSAPGAAALASAVYKSVEPDGGIVYSDAPVKDARAVERLRLPPSPQPDRAPSAPAEQTLQSFRERHQSLQRAHERMLEARTEVTEAERRRAQAQEPLPGERVGNANGTSRLRPEYAERFARHEREVAQARARLEAALQELREAR